MITNLDLCDLQAQIYADPVPGRWDHIFGGILGKVGHVVIGDTSVVCWPGSKYGMDWIEDFDAVPVDPNLGIGLVHIGMIAEVLATHARLDAVIKDKVIVSGHSLGAAHSLLYGAYLAAKGTPPLKVLALAPPRCSFWDMWNALSKAPDVECVWNTGDEVPDLPPLPWIPSAKFTRITVPADPTDTSRFRFHHLALYRAGLAGLGQ